MWSVEKIQEAMPVLPVSFQNLLRRSRLISSIRYYSVNP